MEMRLYHYTSCDDRHLGSILRQGSVRTTESNISLLQPDAGPRVVWLTTNPDVRVEPVSDHGLNMTGVGRLKTTARLTVEVDDAHHWPDWAREQGITEETYAALLGDDDAWYVRTRPVDRTAIVEIDIAPVGEMAGVTVAGDELWRLFHSRGAQRALDLNQRARAWVDKRRAAGGCTA